MIETSFKNMFSTRSSTNWGNVLICIQELIKQLLVYSPTKLKGSINLQFHDDSNIDLQLWITGNFIPVFHSFSSFFQEDQLSGG